MTTSFKILLVEDNPANQALMIKQVKMLGHQLETASDGQKALDKIRSNNYDLVLTDCHMPVMDGFEMTRQLRAAESAGQRLPVIAITADAMDGTRERCIDAGMDDYLTKPIQMAAMKTLFQQLAEQRKNIHTAVAAAGAVTEAANVSASVDEVIDPNALPDMLGVSDPESLIEFYNSFIELGQRVLDDMHVSYRAGDLQAVGDHGHKLKSSARAVGARELGECCFTLEKSSRAGDTAVVDSEIARIDGLFAQVSAWIDQYVRAHS
jgi:two-component system sensor histidine kinase/response regulator